MAQSRARCAAAVVSFAAAAAAAAAGGGVTTATAYVGANGTCTVVPGSFPSNGTAWGRYEDGAAASAQGWGRLEIFTPAAGAADSIAMAYAAGCVEAFLTSHHIGQMAANARANLFPGGLPAVAALFLDVQQGYVRLAVAANYNHSAAAPPQDPFWAASAHLLAQFDGLAAAFAAYAAPGDANVTALDLYALSSGPDLQTLEPLEGFGAAAQGRSRPPVPQRDRLTDCSALVRILPSGDVLVGHDTWAEYWQMLRIYKIYHLSFTAAGTIAFSSYPAMLASSDDFYVTRATQLAVIETTNSVFNMSLLYEISPLSMFTWQRAMAATYNAASGAQWTAMFATSNSGTYNNQWMIFDAKKWVPNATATLTDVLWITEQLPLLMHAADVTDVLLARGYWASYNVPYFQDIYNVSGYLAQYEKYGDEFSYAHCPRARIFARNATSVDSLADAQALLRYNNYAHDPLSHDDPLSAIASRGDLASPPVAFGAYDAKIVSASALASGTLVVSAVCGPTHAQLPVFSWATVPAVLSNVSHIGCPETYDFDWVEIAPT